MAAFADRHIGPRGKDIAKMLAALSLNSIEDLLDETLPSDIRVKSPLNLPEAASEEEALEELYALLGQNESARALIGQGYYNCHVPQVIKRNLFENPAWYTAYTPYQPEISQGRLEMLFNYQTLVAELTGLPVSNASLLDEATAIAEGVLMAIRSHRSKRNKICIGNKLFAQSLDVIETRAAPIGVEISYDDPDADTAALVLQVPDAQGVIDEHAELIAKAKEAGALIIIAADPLSLMLNKTPGELGADIAVGCMQRFGVPLGYGGPHAAYMSCKDEHKRLMPGRLVGQSIDSKGNPAYRLALQTREQHIRREKATSNICTAQALLANMAAAYAIYHGPEGLTEIAARISHMAATFAASATASGFDVVGDSRFDTVTILDAAQLVAPTRKLGYLVHSDDSGSVSVSFDETCDMDTVLRMCKAMEFRMVEVDRRPVGLKNILSQDVFHAHRSETEMMRYLRKLADRDLALDRAMIPLGSCTMKLNAAAEMAPVSWSEISNQHPFVPKSMAQGTLNMISQLEDWLCEVTGFAGVSMQPNAGSQGEYAGLLAIKAYHASRGEAHRNICIIPTSAHGTNPASAFMAGMKVVAVKCDAEGNIDVADLEAKAEKHSYDLAALMVTYPSTHGVFETSIKHICQVVHDKGGQVYLDGANLNAMVGLAKPGEIGGDVCHMNLHKTFCIPHGGGGPGVGPIGVAAHLVPFLPGHSRGDSKENAVSATEHGSASILPISWMYVRMMGADGLRRASALSILSANYIAKKLEGHFEILYKGEKGRVAHECIVDVRPMDKAHGISVEDIAKRLIDYGFHAPTMSWPVAGTLMIEPTESEPLVELDRFCDAMIGIAKEAIQYSGQADSPLKFAPFTVKDATATDWNHSFTREQAIMPAGEFAVDKFWPPVGRVDNVYGDKNLICTCPTVEEMAEAA